MKIKADFVTNSSSSAFIVVWPHEIGSEDDVSQYIKRSDFIPIITRDALEKKGMKASIEDQAVIDKVVDEMVSGYVEETYDHNYQRTFCKKHNITEKELSNNPQWRSQMWNEEDQLQKEKCEVLAIKFLKKHEGNFLYFFEYGDEDGALYSDLEHENDWGGLPFMQISHH